MTERYLKEGFGRYYVNKPFLRKLIIKHGSRKELAEEIGVNDNFLYSILVRVQSRVSEKSARKLLRLGKEIILGRNPIYMPNVEYIKAQMAARGLNQARTAESLNISESTMSQILGGRKSLRPKTAKKLIKFFGKESIKKV